MIHAAPSKRPVGMAGHRNPASDCRSTLSFGVLLLAVTATSFACLPLFYLVLGWSLQSIGALFGLTHWPAIPGPVEWWTLLADLFAPPITRHLAGTLAASFMVVLVALFLGVTADYAFGRAPFRGRLGTALVLGVALLPQVMLLSSVFEVARVLHLYNHWWGLSMPYLTFTLPFAVWAVMVFTSRSRVGPWREVGRRRLWSTAFPALLGTALVAFIAAWNEFMFSVTFVLDGTQGSPPLSRLLSRGPEQVGLAVAIVAVLAALAAAVWAATSRRERLRGA